jgi:hypothetical protein
VTFFGRTIKRGDVSRLDEKRVAKNFRNSIVEVLDGFVIVLLEIMKRRAQSACCIFCSICSKKFSLDRRPVAFVEARDVIEGVGPRDGFVAEAEEELVAYALVVVPVGDAGRTSEAFDELMWGDSILVLASVEERDVGRPANLVVLSEGLSDVCGGHDEVGNVEEGEQTSLR